MAEARLNDKAGSAGTPAVRALCIRVGSSHISRSFTGYGTGQKTTWPEPKTNHGQYERIWKYQKVMVRGARMTFKACVSDGESRRKLQDETQRPAMVS